MRFVRDVFNEYQESTIGGARRGWGGRQVQRAHAWFFLSVAAYFTQTVPVDGDVIKFNVWDTAGQERVRLSVWMPARPRAMTPYPTPGLQYHSLAPMYYRGAKAGVVVYDITSMVRR